MATTVKLNDALSERIEQAIEDSSYHTKAEFVRETLRQRLDEEEE